MDGLHGWYRNKFTCFMDKKYFGLCSDTTDLNRYLTCKVMKEE